MFLLIPAAITGGATTAVLLWPFGVLVALIAAPFGGSLLAVVAAGFLAWQSSGEAQTDALAEVSLDPSFAGV